MRGEVCLRCFCWRGIKNKTVPHLAFNGFHIDFKVISLHRFLLQTVVNQ